ncbi:hypothetical protein A5881_003860 [Enterococcus termitis]|nr:hypothetical protein A5881_003753 [Enterococcus termitis]
MITIGIVDRDNKTLSRLKELVNSENYNLKRITEKEQLSTIDTLIIVETDKSEGGNLSEVIDWLISSRENSSLIVWFFSERLLPDQEQTILLRLGCNGIVMLYENLPHLWLIINNLFNREMKQNNGKSVKNKELLNDLNQTILINNIEKPLTKKEFQLLSVLNEKKNTTVSYKKLMSILWPNGSTETTYKLANIVFKLREKIESSNDFKIVTTRSKGYMLKLKR